MGNPRAWSDKELEAAVASQHTWRAVARELGLAPSSTNGVRRHVRRLGLDTSHFRHPRRAWSDDDLRSAVSVAATWTDVMRELGLGETTSRRWRVIARARSLGLEVNPREGPSQPEGAAGIGMTKPDIGQLRSAAERIAIAWFALRGTPVSVPTDQRAYDLLVTLPDGLQRIQVKSGAYRAMHGTWRIGVGRRPYTRDKSAPRLPYDPEEIDYYFIVDGDGALYLIPSSVLGGRTHVNIGPYIAYRVGDASSLLATAA